MSRIVSRPHLAHAAHSDASPKVPRQDIVSLSIEADRCPQVLMRVLGLVAVRGLTPLTIFAQHGEQSVTIRIDLAALPEPAGSVLLEKVRAIVTVRDAQLRQFEFCTEHLPGSPKI